MAPKDELDDMGDFDDFPGDRRQGRGDGAAANLKMQVQIDALLGIPFDEAMVQCEALKKYIDTHEEGTSLKQEFRSHWGPSAPQELRQVIEELLNPVMAAANAQAAAAFEEDPLGTAPLLLAMDAAGGEAPTFDDAAALVPALPLPRGAEAPAPRSAAPAAPASREEVLGEMSRSGDEVLAVAAANDESGGGDAGSREGSELDAKIEHLLSLPWERAVEECAPLRAYIKEREDAADLEKEFRQHWGPQAPDELRAVLSEVLDPATAEAAKADREAILRTMKVQGFADRVAAGAEEAAGGSTDGEAEKPPRSRL